MAARCGVGRAELMLWAAAAAAAALYVACLRVRYADVADVGRNAPAVRHRVAGG
eukprot:gene39782-55382_t